MPNLNHSLHFFSSFCHDCSKTKVCLSAERHAGSELYPQRSVRHVSSWDCCSFFLRSRQTLKLLSKVRSFFAPDRLFVIFKKKNPKNQIIHSFSRVWSLCVHSPLSFRFFFFSVAVFSLWAHVNPVIVSFAGGWMESRVRLLWETERHLWKCIPRVFARQTVVLVSQYASSQRPSLHPPHPASPIHTHWRSRVVLLEERNSSFLCMALKCWEFPFLGSQCSRESLVRGSHFLERSRVFLSFF